MGHPSWALLHCHPEPSSQADVSLSWSEVELPGSSRAPVTTGVSVLQEVADAIFVTPTRTFIGRYNYKQCQGLTSWLVFGLLPWPRQWPRAH